MDKGSNQTTVPSMRLPMLSNFAVNIPSKKYQKKFQKTVDKPYFPCYNNKAVKKCGSGSVVERHLAKVNVASSNLVFRSI